MEKKERWTVFAAAAIGNQSGLVFENVAAIANFASALADQMEIEYDERFGDAKFLLDGQLFCAACRKPLDEATIPAFISTDNLKFCNKACCDSLLGIGK